MNFANAIHNVPSTLARAGLAGRQPGPERSRPSSSIAPEPAQQHDAGQPERRRLPAHAAGPRLRLRVGQAGPTCRPGWTRRRSRSTPTSHRRSDVTERPPADRSTTTAPRGRPAVTARSRRRRETLRNLAFLSPWLLGTGLFFVYPLVSTAYFSFTHYNGFSPPTFDGLDNWTVRLPATTRSSGRPCATRLWFVAGDGHAAGDLRRSPSACSSSGSSEVPGCCAPCFYAPYLAPPVAGTLAFVFLLNPGTGPVNTILGRLGLPEPGLVQRPGVVEAGAHPAGAVGHRRPDGHLHGRAARRAEGALRGGRAGRRRRGRPVPLRHPAAPAADHRLRGRHRRDRDDAVLHAADRGGRGRQRAHPGFRASSSSPAIPDKSTLTLPQLVYNLGFQRFDIGAACVVALVLFGLSMAFAAVLMRRGSVFLGGSDT